VRGGYDDRSANGSGHNKVGGKRQEEEKSYQPPASSKTKIEGAGWRGGES